MSQKEAECNCAKCRDAAEEPAGGSCPPQLFCPHCALSPQERALLERFGQTPFLPLVQDPDRGRVILLEEGFESDEAWWALLTLSRRGFIRIDPEIPVANADYGAHEGMKRGSAALTRFGQEELDRLEYGETLEP